MKKTLEKLWNEYLSSECAVIDTDEERMLTKKAAELHERLDVLLDNEQRAAVEKIIDALCDVNAIFTKKAFLKGCEFAVCFLLEAGELGK